jgi:hypothetical protein
VATGPGDELEAAARGRLRASHADREHVIGVLKAAFVQGRLAKDEFDLRVGQTLAAWTYADLAAVTADLPAGLGVAKPSQPARPQDEPMQRPGRMIAAATAAYAGAWASGLVLIPHVGGNRAVGLLINGVFYFGSIAYLLAWLVAVVNMIALWREKRSGGQSPRQPALGAGDQASRCRSSADPGGQLPPADPGHQRAAEVGRSRRSRPSLPGSRALRRWRAGGLLARQWPVVTGAD